MPFRNHAFATFAFSACALAASSALAVAPQRTFVASYGLDTATCSLSAPCRGFQAAINAVAAGGEVVAIDTAGYGAMEIHKSVSVIVPPGIHAGLSPATGIPLPGYPGQSGVVLIDIQNTDIVVLRGLNINHQGTVTGGIEWIGTNGGTVQIENVVVNGFPNEGLYVQAPGGKLLITDSTFRNNGIGIYAGLASALDTGLTSGVSIDHALIESSAEGIRVLGGAGLIHVSNTVLRTNSVAIHVQNADASIAYAGVFLDHSNVVGNGTFYVLEGIDGTALLLAAASTVYGGFATSTRTGYSSIYSLGGQNLVGAAAGFFDQTGPPQ